MKSVLTIGGSDCSGGAGIQGDIKTISAHQLYASSVITALTAQNTLGVQGITDVPEDFFQLQLTSVLDDIFPNAIKIGMLPNQSIMETLTALLQQYPPTTIVLDPVMVSTSGRTLMDSDSISYLTKFLFPLATLITPNIPEAEILSGISILNQDDMIAAAQYISQHYHVNVLLKGGHQPATANDLFYQNGSVQWFPGIRIDNPNTHGTGCTLSSAIASRLALGFTLSESIGLAKDYITGAIKSGLNLGHGNGPLNHMYLQKPIGKELK